MYIDNDEDKKLLNFCEGATPAGDYFQNSKKLFSLCLFFLIVLFVFIP